MSVLGIVAEYNPFHNGHLFHLNTAIDQVKPQSTIIALSGCFTQRGDPAFQLPSRRAEEALLAGADAVFEIPSCWTLRDADHYADAAVGMLSALGITHLAFGTEEKDPSLLAELNDYLYRDDAELQSFIRTKLSEGLGYPAAVSACVSDLRPEFKGLLDKPNNILALSYLRSIRAHHPHIKPVFIMRNGDYGSTVIHQKAPSATAVRSALLRGDWQGVRSAVPGSTYSLLRRDGVEGHLIRPDTFSDILLYLLRTSSYDVLSSLPDLSEGLENRLRNTAAVSLSAADLLNGSCSRRYPRARINRLCADLLLGIDKNVSVPDQIPAAILLGIRKGTILQESRIQIVSKIADFKCNEEWFRYEILSYELAALAACLPSGLAFRQGVVTI